MATLTPWILSGLFGLFWLLCAGGNLVSVAGAARRGGSTSLVLFFGGVAGMIAVLVCPVPGIWAWFWVPPLLDLGSFPALAVMVYARFRQKGEKP